MRQLVALYALLAWCTGCGAIDIYRSVDPERGVEYSDTPRPGAKHIVIEPALPTPAPSPNGVVGGKLPAAAPDAASTVPRAYQKIVITSPSDQETIRDNGGNILVSVQCLPALQTTFGHRMSLLVDAAPSEAPGTATNFTLTNLFRGTHTLQAVVGDAAGHELLRSAVATIYVHRHSVNESATPPAPAK
ncbi:MAG: hypothetical protein HYX63_10340 [Gammaproteobacteria bacterium]|nr:hypothetical protein [Gammaproteobacteria bacterium]